MLSCTFQQKLYLLSVFLHPLRLRRKQGLRNRIFDHLEQVKAKVSMLFEEYQLLVESTVEIAIIESLIGPGCEFKQCKMKISEGLAVVILFVENSQE